MNYWYKNLCNKEKLGEEKTCLKQIYLDFMTGYWDFYGCRFWVSFLLLNLHDRSAASYLTSLCISLSIKWRQWHVILRLDARMEWVWWLLWRCPAQSLAHTNPPRSPSCASTLPSPLPPAPDRTRPGSGPSAPDPLLCSQCAFATFSAMLLIVLIFQGKLPSLAFLSHPAHADFSWPQAAE